MRKLSQRKALRRTHLVFLVLILAAAIFIRFQNLGERSLWLDEAWVANAVSEDSLSALAESSFHAPLFFVLAVHVLITFFGNNEFVLRLLPCLFGIGTLVVFYWIIRKHTGKTAALLSLLLLSFSPHAVRYSQELKQYTSAMFFAILLVYLCERVVSHDKNRDWTGLILFSILGIGFDHSLAFMVPAVFLVLLLSLPLEKYWKKILASGSVVFIFSLFFFLFHLRHQISESLVSAQSYWLPYYPRTTSPGVFLKWLSRSFVKMFDFFSVPYFYLSLVIMVIGLSLFYKNSKKRFLIYILLPPLLVLAASFLRRYPFGGSRLMLFAAPLLYLSFAKGLDFMFIKLRTSRMLIPLFLLAVLMVVPPVSQFIHTAKHPVSFEEMRPLLRKLEKRIHPGDKIYVYYGALEAFKYYSRTRYPDLRDKQNVFWGEYHRDNPSQYVRELEKFLDKDTRLWVVFSHYRENERLLILDYLDQRGDLITKISDKGTLAYLYEITKTTDTKSN
ncbi:MAG: glycosyltransferase family 39 protein [Candidatus Aminicenantes bacterium]